MPHLSHTLSGAALAVLLLCVATGCNNAEQQAEALAEARLLRPTSLDVTIEEIGVLEATRVETITAPFRGKVIYIAENGQQVKEGDPVLTLETTDDVEELDERLTELKTIKSDLEANIESLEIAMRSNELDVDYAESELEFQRLKLDEVNTRLAETGLLVESNVVPGDDLRRASNEAFSSRYNTMNKDLSLRERVLTRQSDQVDDLTGIERQKLRGERARRRIDEVAQRIEEATVEAPVTGMFMRKKKWSWRQQSMVEPKPGDSVRGRQEVGEIPDLNTLIVKSQIPESDLGRVSEGTPVELVFDAYDGLVLEGEISKIGKVAIEREASAAGSLVSSSGYSGQKVFEVDIDLKETTPELKPGITAQVRIIVDRKDQVLSIPIDYVYRRDGETFTTVVTPKGEKVARRVQPGARNQDEVVITGGLEAGERVIKAQPPA